MFEVLVVLFFISLFFRCRVYGELEYDGGRVVFAYWRVADLLPAYERP